MNSACMRHLLRRIFVAAGFSFFLIGLAAFAQDDAPGAPGSQPHHWPPALKQAVGTAFDSDASVVRLHVKFHFNRPGLKIFVLMNPTLGGSGRKTIASATPRGLFAGSSDSDVHCALQGSLPWRKTSSGYVAASDGWQDVS